MMLPCSDFTSFAFNTPTVEFRQYAATQSRQSPCLPFGSAMTNRNAAIVLTEKWQLDCLKVIASYGKLSANWDGYGSRPPTEFVRLWASELITRTQLGILPPPQIAPESDGGLQIDWCSGLDREIELHIDGGASIEFLKVQNGKGIESGMFSVNDRAAVDGLLNWLCR